MTKSQTKRRKPAVYRLYAAYPTRENVGTAAESRFQRVTSRYILLYTEKKPGKAWTEVAGDDLGRLTDQDQAWLWDCGKVLAAEVLARRQEESGRRMAELLDRLEEELRREMTEEGVRDHGEPE